MHHPDASRWRPQPRSIYYADAPNTLRLGPPWYQLGKDAGMIPLLHYRVNEIVCERSIAAKLHLTLPRRARSNKRQVMSL